MEEGRQRNLQFNNIQGCIAHCQPGPHETHSQKRQQKPIPNRTTTSLKQQQKHNNKNRCHVSVLYPRLWIQMWVHTPRYGKTPRNSDSWPEECQWRTEEVSQETTEAISLSFTTWRGLWTQGCFSLSLWLGGRFGSAAQPTRAGESLSENKSPTSYRCGGAAVVGRAMSKDERRLVWEPPFLLWIGLGAAHLQLLFSEGQRGTPALFPDASPCCCQPRPTTGQRGDPSVQGLYCTAKAI